MTLALFSMELLWRNALAAIPLALAVALICRLLPCRAATRHALWLIVLLSLMAPPLLPGYDLSTIVPAKSVAAIDHEALAPSTKPALPQSKPIVQSNVQPPPFVVNAAKKPLHTIFDFTKAAADVAYTPSAAAPVAPAQEPLPAASQSPPMVRRSNMAPRAERTSASPLVREMFTPAPASAPTETESATVTAPLSSTPLHKHKDDRNQVAVAASELALLNRAEKTTIANSSPAAIPVESNASVAPFIQWQQWFAGVIGVRDAITRLTPVPMTLWFGGCLVIATVLAIRTIRFRRILNRSNEAPACILREVNRASREIGLRQAPRTLVTDARVSPMIWCGFNRVLLLPRSLWDELDSIGRHAVLLHELAHLRRRDHWVRWTELIIGCLYWWHPVVWYIRKKLRDEADHCCDAWVTSLAPASRTSYARALVATRQYISESHNAMPAVGLGIANNRTKRFARRLTMVMTERSTPRLSTFGGSMTLCLAAVAWLAAPLWACPPESKQHEVERTSVKAAKKAVEAEKAAIATLRAAKAPRAAAEEQLEASTFEKHMLERERSLAPANQGADPFGDPRTQDRLDRLEERLNRLTEQLERLAGETPQARGMSSPRSAVISIPRAPQAPQTPRISVAPSMKTTVPQPRKPAKAAKPALPAPPAPPATPAPPAHGAQPWVHVAPGAFGGTTAVIGHDGQKIKRIYQLPQGKREALYELMARNDVPVLVASANEGISVEATPQQHEAFRSFIVLIHPESAQVHGQPAIAYARSVDARALEEAAAKAFAGAATAWTTAHPKAIEELNSKLRSNQVNLERLDLERQVQELHRRAEELTRKARQLENQSSHLESQADEIEDDGAREELMARAIALMTEAEGFEDQADSFIDGADALEELLASLHEGDLELLADEAMLESIESAVDSEEIQQVIEEMFVTMESAADDIEVEVDCDVDLEIDEEDSTDAEADEDVEVVIED